MHRNWNIKEIQDVVNTIADDFNYSCTLPIEISKRAKNRLGAFFFKKEKDKICGVKFVFAERLIDGTFSEEIVKEVIIHEYLHYYCDTKTNTNNGHNKFFKEMCLKSNISPKATLKNEFLMEKIVAGKEYLIYCKKCGKLVCVHKRKDAAHRKIKGYISSCCRAKLIVK